MLYYNVFSWLTRILTTTAITTTTPIATGRSPHPAQAAPWSILRMTVFARLGAALAVSAGLWAVVWLAMR